MRYVCYEEKCPVLSPHDALGVAMKSSDWNSRGVRSYYFMNGDDTVGQRISHVKRGTRAHIIIRDAG